MVYFLRILVVILSFALRPFYRRWRPGKPVRCLLVGFSGANNTGAEARLQCIIEQMKPAAKFVFTVASLNRGRTLRYLPENDHVHISKVSPFFIFDIAKLVLRADLVVLAEGYCFMDRLAPALFWMFMFAADLAERLRVATMIYAVDAGELSTEHAKWARRVVDHCDVITVRSQAAANVLNSIGVAGGVPVTADPALSLEPAPADWARQELGERSVIGIAFDEPYWWPVAPNLVKFIKRDKVGCYRSIFYHTWDAQRREKSAVLRERIAQYADWVTEEFDADIAFFAMDRINKEPIRDIMSMMAKSARLFDADEYEAHELLGLIAEMRMTVCGDYHAVLFSLMNNVPVIGVAGDERISALLYEAKLADECSVDYDGNDVLMKLKLTTADIMQHHDAFSARIREAMSSQFSRNIMNKTYCAKLMQNDFPTHYVK